MYLFYETPRDVLHVLGLITPKLITVLTILTIDQKTQLKKLKDLSRVIADYVAIAETEQDPGSIDEAIKAIEYYQRNYFKP